jgi:hypothetical protein
MVTGFHSHFFHPHLTSPIKGEEVFWQFGQTADQEPPSRGQPEATRSAGGASLVPPLPGFAPCSMLPALCCPQMGERESRSVMETHKIMGVPQSEGGKEA